MTVPNDHRIHPLCASLEGSQHDWQRCALCAHHRANPHRTPPKRTSVANEYDLGMERREHRRLHYGGDQ